MYISNFPQLGVAWTLRPAFWEECSLKLRSTGAFYPGGKGKAGGGSYLLSVHNRQVLSQGKDGS